MPGLACPSPLPRPPPSSLSYLPPSPQSPSCCFPPLPFPRRVAARWPVYDPLSFATCPAASCRPAPAAGVGRGVPGACRGPSFPVLLPTPFLFPPLHFRVPLFPLLFPVPTQFSFARAAGCEFSGRVRHRDPDGAAHLLSATFFFPNPLFSIPCVHDRAARLGTYFPSSAPGPRHIYHRARCTRAAPVHPCRVLIPVIHRRASNDDLLLCGVNGCSLSLSWGRCVTLEPYSDSRVSVVTSPTPRTALDAAGGCAGAVAARARARVRPAPPA